MSESAAQPNIDELAGPFVVQPLIACTLFGITLVQSRSYFHECAEDSRVLIIAIATLYALQWFYVASLANVSYTFTVTNFGNYANLSRPPALFCIGATITGIFTFVTQLYYSRQVYVISSRKKLLPIVIITLALVSFVFTIISTVKGYSYGDFRKFDEFEYGVLIWLSAAAAADVLITVSLVYYLRRHRTATSFAETRSLLSRVIANTIENNALTCIVASVDAIAFSQYKRWGSWHVILNGALVGLYFTSLLTSLNARHRFAAQRQLVRHLDSDLLRPTSRASGERRPPFEPDSATRNSTLFADRRQTPRERSQSASIGAALSMFKALKPRAPKTALVRDPAVPPILQARVVQEIRREKLVDGNDEDDRLPSVANERRWSGRSDGSDVIDKGGIQELV